MILPNKGPDSILLFRFFTARSPHLFYTHLCEIKTQTVPKAYSKRYRPQWTIKAVVSTDVTPQQPQWQSLPGSHTESIKTSRFSGNKRPADQTLPEADIFPSIEQISAFPFLQETAETEENVAATEEIAEEAAPIAQSNEPFDSFIATLSEEQKAAFIDLYVLKCKTPMPEIPTYEVGGNNKAFFNKVFIYLGQYRDKIPSDLLEKIYEHSMKI